MDILNYYSISLKSYLEALSSYNKILDLKIKMLTVDSANNDTEHNEIVPKFNVLYNDFSEKIVLSAKPILQIINEADLFEIPISKIQSHFSHILSTIFEYDTNIQKLDLSSLKDLAASCYLKLDKKSNLPQYQNLQRSINKLLTYCIG